MKNKKLVIVLGVILFGLLCAGTAFAAICPTCRGVGWNICIRCNGGGTYENRNGDYVDCGVCKGEGKVTCFPCGGTGER